MRNMSLSFTSTAFNESGNILELYQRCRSTYEAIKEEFSGILKISFSFVIADNASIDNSIEILKEINLDPDVHVLVNHANYGPEASAANALRVASDSDIVVLLCSDLQDPPELAQCMVKMLLQREDLDAVLAVKKNSSGNKLMRFARVSYYKALGYSTRLQHVPDGFHGFGCYRKEAIEEALRYWDSTDLNLRLCLANASHSTFRVNYFKAERVHGRSSYEGFGYWREAIRSLAAGDATASRVALFTGITGLLLAIIVGILLLLNVMSGTSGYVRGIPTILGITVMSFVVQMLMFGLLSRQIEAVRMGGMRKKVRFHSIRKN
jgi:glycosyltransferase involved in cell wall biosynthesis